MGSLARDQPGLVTGTRARWSANLPQLAQPAVSQLAAGYVLTAVGSGRTAPPPPWFGGRAPRAAGARVGRAGLAARHARGRLGGSAAIAQFRAQPQGFTGGTVYTVRPARPVVMPWLTRRAFAPGAAFLPAPVTHGSFIYELAAIWRDHEAGQFCGGSHYECGAMQATCGKGRITLASVWWAAGTAGAKVSGQWSTSNANPSAQLVVPAS